MPSNKVEFLKFCQSIIPEPFDGEINKLQSFIHAIELLEKITPSKFREIFLIFVKSKLICIDAITATSIEEVIDALKRECNSRVIIGQIQTLRIINGDFLEFSQKLKFLGNKLICAWMIEGIPKIIATDLTIDHIRKTCKRNCNYYFVRIILTASEFKTVDEVIAKFLMETARFWDENKINLRNNFRNGVQYRPKYNVYSKNNNNFNNAEYVNRKNMKNLKIVETTNNDIEFNTNDNDFSYDLGGLFAEKCCVKNNAPPQIIENKIKNNLKIKMTKYEKNMLKKCKNDEKIKNNEGKNNYEKYIKIALNNLTNILLTTWIILNEIININNMKIIKKDKIRKFVKKSIDEENFEDIKKEFKEKSYEKLKPNENIPPDKYFLRFMKFIHDKCHPMKIA